MNKLKCVNCGIANYETVRVCFSCRKPVTPTADLYKFSSSAHQKDRSTTSANKQTNFKNVIAGILLTAILGAGAYYGYLIYSGLADDAQKQAQAAKTNSGGPIKGVSEFKNDTESIMFGLYKMPPEYQIAPPDLETVNKFPFAEKTLTVSTPTFLGWQCVPDRSPGVSAYHSGGKIYQPLKEVAVSDPVTETRLLKITEILSYKYIVNGNGELTATVKVEGDYDGYTVKTIDGTDCRKLNDGTDCGKVTLFRGAGELNMVYRNAAWEMVLIRGYTKNNYERYLLEWPIPPKPPESPIESEEHPWSKEPKVPGSPGAFERKDCKAQADKEFNNQRTVY